jgi:hypothetical protein
MSEPSDVRVSDEDRERSADAIRQHFAAGRLTDDELSERLSDVYRARTEEELQAVQSDLPKLPASPAQQRAELVQRRARLQRHMLQQAGGSLGVLALCTFIWLTSSGHDHGEFWPMWVGLVAVLALVRNTWRLYGPEPELDQVEADLTRRKQREPTSKPSGAADARAAIRRRDGPGRLPPGAGASSPAQALLVALKYDGPGVRRPGKSRDTARQAAPRNTRCA